MVLTAGEGTSKMATLSKMQCGPLDKPLEKHNLTFWKDFAITKKEQSFQQDSAGNRSVTSVYFTSECKIQMGQK